MYDVKGLYSFVDLLLQNVKGVFDAAIRVVLQPPKQKKKKNKAQKACAILWLNSCKEINSYLFYLSPPSLFLFPLLLKKLRALRYLTNNTWISGIIRWLGVAPLELFWSLIVESHYMVAHLYLITGFDLFYVLIDWIAPVRKTTLLCMSTVIFIT